MVQVCDQIPADVRGHPTANLAWKRLGGTPRFDYHIDYSIALLRVDEDEQRVEFLSTWEPEAYCHFHRHLGPTSSLIVAGELHVHETDEFLELHKVRKTGHATSNDGGDVHMEHGGPDGAVAYYDMKAVDGLLFEVLASDGRVIRSVRFEDFVSGNY